MTDTQAIAIIAAILYSGKFDTELQTAIRTAAKLLDYAHAANAFLVEKRKERGAQAHE
jgi:hypothetical protein